MKKLKLVNSMDLLGAQKNTRIKTFFSLFFLFCLIPFGSTQDEAPFSRLKTLAQKNDHQLLKWSIDSIENNAPDLFREHLHKFLRYRGEYYSITSNYTEAFKCYFDALKLAELRDDELEIAHNKLALGTVFTLLNEPNLSLKMLSDACHMFYGLEDYVYTARCMYLEGVAYKKLGKFQLSNGKLNKSYEFYSLAKDSSGMANVNQALGLNYKNRKQPQSAIPYFKKAIDYLERNGHSAHLAKAYNNLANTYLLKEDWENALFFQKKSMEIKRTVQDSLGLAVSHINISAIYKGMDDYETALSHGDSSLKIVNQMSLDSNEDPSRINNCKIGIYELLSDLYEKMEMTDTALEYAKKGRSLVAEKKVSDEEKLIALFEKKQNVEFYSISDSLLNHQKVLEKKVSEAQSQNEFLTERNIVFRNALIAICGLLFCLLIILYWRFRMTTKIKDQLVNINHELIATRIGKEEKEVLLQEIHHRVKNNMQIISSLIRLQSNNITSDTDKNLFMETQNRINSMALVHEQLYKTNSFEQLKLNDYLNELINHLIDSYGSSTVIEKRIDISFDKASIDYIIPIGLIVNEIISNSLKHGFTNREKGRITVLFEPSGSDYLLFISDDGHGDPNDISGSKGSLGMELIESLAHQIDATYTVDKINGFAYSIIIPEIVKD